MNDLFELKITESAEEDIMNAPITEDASDKSATITTGEGLANADAVTVPEGRKETPSAKPYDAATITVPGGGGETPSGKPYDQAAVSIPGSSTISAEAHNKALSRLKQSFKEGFEILQMMENMTVVNDVELLQEQAETTAILESLMNGPYYDASTTENKKEIKESVVALKSKMSGVHDFGFMTESSLLKIYQENKTLKPQAWQTIGFFVTESDGLDKYLEQFGETFKEDIGSFVVEAVKVETPEGFEITENKSIHMLFMNNPKIKPTE